MRTLIQVVILIFVLLLLQTTTHAQTDDGTRKVQPPEKTLRYHQALQRRPSPGYLFDRFYNSWLDTASLDHLESFLKQSANQSKSTNDQLLLAFFYTKQGDYVKAIQLYRVALENDPTNAQAWYEKAVVEARNLDFETALQDLDNANKAKPKKDLSINIGKLKGRLLARNRQTVQANQVWQTLIDEHSADESLVEDIIELQISEGLYDAAIQLSDKLIAMTRDPYEKVMRQLRKGDVTQLAGKQDEALKIYNRSLAMAGAGTWLEREIIGQIEEVFRREDNLIGLKEYYAKLISDQENRISLKSGLAKLSIELGLFDEAIKQYKKIIEITPGDRGHRETFINILLQADQKTHALQQLKSLIGQNPDDSELRLRLAKIMFEFNRDQDPTEAVEALNQFVTLSGQTEYAFLRAARVLSRFNQKKHASETFARCIAKFPKSETAREAYADHLYQDEKKEDALKLWRQLAENGKADKVVRISRIMSARKEHQAAFDLLFSHYDRHKLNSGFLGQLCSEAIAVKKVEQAIPWAMNRVKFANSALELEGCIGQAINLISKSNRTEKIITDLSSDAEKSVSTICLLAELQEQIGQGQAADETLKSALAKLKQEPLTDSAKNQNALQMLAKQRVRVLSNRQDWTNAVLAAKDLIELPGGRKSANIRSLIELFQRDGQLEQAIAWIGEWKKVSPGSRNPWFQESNILDRMGRIEDAISVLRRARQKFPEDADLSAQLGQRFVINGQYSEAERIYWQQYESAKQLSDKLRWTEQLAQVADETGQLDELIERFNERKKNNPRSIEPILALAQAHRVADNYEQRRKALLEATRLQEDNLPLLLEIARLEETEGDWEEAIQTLQKAEPLDKTNRTKQRMAQLYIRFGEVERGFEILIDTADGGQTNPREVEKIADAMIAVDDWQLAKDFLQPIADRFPDDFRLHYLMGVIDEELDLIDDASDQFIRLLGFKNELSGLSSNLMTNALEASQLASIVPPGLMEIYHLMEMEDAAYSYVRENRGWRYQSYSAAVVLPTTIEENRILALAHLKTIAEQVEDGQRDSLIAATKAAGVTNAEFLFALDNDFYSLTEESEIFDELPANDTTMALMVIGPFSSDVTDAKRLVEISGKLNPRYPELAFLAALRAASLDKEHHELLNTKLNQIDRLKPSPVCISAIASTLMGVRDIGPMTDSQLSKEQFSKLSQLLIDWYPKIQVSQSSPWTFTIVARAIASDKSGKRFIEFLDDEVVRSNSRQRNRNAQSYSPWAGSSNGTILRPIGLPPNEFVSFPQQVVRLLDFGDPEENYYDPFSDDKLEPQSWADRYGPVIDHAKDPMLKVLLLLKFAESDTELIVLPEKERYASVQETLDTMLKANSPNPDAYLLAAGLATRLEQWNRATEILDKLRNLPIGRTTRQAIDGALVSISIEGIGADLENPKYAALVESSRAAGLRLRRARLQPEQRLSLVGALETLGLSKEAEKMEEKLAQMGTAGNIFGPTRGGSSNAATPIERIRELVDAGKSDAAIRLLASQFKNQLQQAFDLNSMIYSDYERYEFIAQLKALELEDELVQHLDPGDSTSSSKLQAYGYALECLERDEEAIDTYEQLVTKSKRQSGARVRMILLMNKLGRDVRPQLAQVDAKKMPEVAFTIIQSIEEHEADIGDVFRLAGFITDYAEKNVDSEEHDLSWMTQIQIWLGRTIAVDENASLPSIYFDSSEAADESRTTSKKYQKAEAQRSALFERVNRIMLKRPALASNAFSALVRKAEAHGDKDLERFVPDAIAAISIQSNLPSKQNPLDRVMPSGIYSRFSREYPRNSAALPPSRSPVEFLAFHLGSLEVEKRDSMRQQLERKLTEVKQLDAVQELNQLVALYSASPDSFAKEAQTYLSATKDNKKNTNFSDALRTVVEIWSENNSSSDIDDLISEALTTDDRRVDQEQLIPYATQYLAGLMKQNQEQRVLAILDTQINHLFGSREKQKELVAKAYESGNLRRKERMAITTHNELFSSMLQQKDLIGIGLNEAQESGIPIERLNIHSHFVNHISSFEDAQSLLDWFGSVSPFLNDLETFDSIPTGGTEGSVLSQLASRIQYEQFAAYEDLVKLLTDKKQRTFGEEVLLLVINSNGSIDAGQELYQALADRIEQLKRLPEERQRMVAQFVSDLSTNSEFQLRTSGSLTDTEELETTKKYVDSLLAVSISSEVERLMNAKRFSDLKMDSYSFSEWLKNTLTRMDRTDSDQWIATFTHALELADLQQSQSGYGSFNETSVDLMSEMLSSRLDYDWVRILVKLIHDHPESKVFLIDRINSSIAEFLLTKLTTKSDELSIDLQSVREIYKEMGTELRGLETTGLIPVFHTLLYRIDEEELPKIEEWIQSEALHGKFKNLAHDLDLTMEIIAATNRLNAAFEASQKNGEPQERTRSETLTERQQKLLGLLNDEQLSLSARLGIVSSLAKYDPSLPPELAWSCSEIMAKGLNEELTLSESTETRMIWAINDIGRSSDITEKAIPFADAWAKKYLRPQSSIRYSHVVSYGRDGEMSRMAEVIRMFASLDRKPMIERVLRRFPEESFSRDIVAVLVEQGLHAQARRILDRLWATPNQFSNDAPTVRYNRQMEEALPAFVKIFGNDATKLLAEVSLASLPDTTQVDSRASQLREERLSQLVKKYPSVEFKSKTQDQLALVMLVPATDAAEYISEKLNYHASRLKTIDLWSERGQGDFEHNRDVLAAWMLIKLNDGNFEPILTRFEELDKAKPKSNDYYYRRVVEGLTESLDKSIKEKVMETPAAEMKELLPILRNLAGRLSLEYSNSDIPIYTATAHALTGETQAYRDWLKSLEEKALEAANAQKAELTDEAFEIETVRPFLNSDMDEAWEFVAEILKKSGHDNSPESHRKLITELWQLAGASGFSIGTGHFREGVRDSCSGCRTSIMGLESIVEAKLMTKEEIAKYGARLAEVESVNGEIWRQVAKEQLRLDNLEEAATSMKASLDSATDEMDQAKSNRTVEYLDILVKLGREAEAQSLMASVKLELLIGANQATYKRLVSELGK